MTKPKVFITRILPQAGLDMLADVAELDIWQEDLPPSYATLKQKAAGKDGLLTLLTDTIDAPVLEAAGKSLKVVSQYAVGYDNIDVIAASQRGIPVGNTPGVLTEATADLTWALLMAAARRVVEGDRFTRAGKWKTWSPTLLLGADVHGATLGIIGFGRIGQALAQRARGFSMNVLYYDVQPKPEAERALGARFTAFDDLLAQADFISVHTWLSPETYHLIGEREFGLMKPGAVFINAARGAIVDAQALYVALSQGKIACAALDVTEPEPINMDSPLLTLENLIVVPHIASASVQARTRMAVMAAQNLLAGLRGERLPYCVNPQVYG